MRTLNLNIKDKELLRRIEFLPDTDLEKVLLKALMEYTEKQINWETVDKKEESHDLSEIMQILQQMNPTNFSSVSPVSNQGAPIINVEQKVEKEVSVTIVPYIDVDSDFDDDDMDLMK